MSSHKPTPPPSRYIGEDGKVYSIPPTTEYFPDRSTRGEPKHYSPSPDFVIALVIGILAGFALAVLVY